MSRNIHDEIAAQVAQHDVVLYMKGSRRMPQCGFSAAVVAALDDVGAAYEDVDVLADSQLRDGIKRFSDWPTVPQLYVRGEFVGGCDIIRDLHSSGKLHKLILDSPQAHRAGGAL